MATLSSEPRWYGSREQIGTDLRVTSTQCTREEAHPAPTPSTKDHTSYSNQAGIISLSLTPRLGAKADQLLAVPFGRPMHLAGLRARFQSTQKS